ncbi:MAG: helix-hairpin-helix domain-containing protein [Saprospiraceae bacterium]|nr:helix-hairpin-helix domain-containing protein [Saprospiraceae bacterium]
MRKRTPSVCVLIFCCQIAYCQISTDSLAYSFQDAIESTVAASDDASFDYDTEFEYLADFIRHPLSINRATTADFEQLRLLSAEQIAAIIAHREKYEHYLSLLELQSVLDLATIHKILPFVTVENSIDDYFLALKDWFKRGKNDVILRWEHRLERAEGYKRLPTEGGYLGDANRLYARYRYSFGNRLSYGFTLEKDAGESFKATGFDFSSFHFKISNLRKGLKTIVLGDYTISFGQGLVHENGFAMGKSALVLQTEKNNLPVRQYTSSNEINFMRGAAVQAQLARHTEGVLFVSYKKRDANILAIDSTDSEAIVSALQFTGLHRTQTELEDNHVLRQFTVGGRIKRTMKTGSIAVNTVYNQFNGRIEPRDEPYNLYAFRGQNLFNTSFDYKKTYKNIHIFGETALSDNGGYGTVNGLLFGVDKRLSISLLQRFFSLKFQTLQAQPFAESSRPQDELGAYLGFEFKPNRTWMVSAYADFWQHQYWRFRVDAPSRGHEFFGKMLYKKRFTEGYIQVRVKTKQENKTDRPDTEKLNAVVDKTRTQVRMQFNKTISKEWTLRNRLEWSFFSDDKGLKKGFVAWQDVLFSFKDSPSSSEKINHILRGLKMTSRLAYFDTKDYDTAIYGYENDVQYSFTVLPYYYRGTRFYVNASYQFMKNGYLEARFARTRLVNQNSFGSGLDKIEGNKRSDVKVQLRFSF